MNPCVHDVLMDTWIHGFLTVIQNYNNFHKYFVGILKFKDCPPHEIHKIQFPMNKNDFPALQDCIEVPGMKKGDVKLDSMFMAALSYYKFKSKCHHGLSISIQFLLRNQI